MKTKLHSILLVFILLFGFSIYGQDNSWKRGTSDGNLNSVSIKDLDAKNFKIYELNLQLFKQSLIDAPLRGATNQFSNKIIQVPNEQGIMESFMIYEAPVLSPSLSLKYPDIKSYVGFKTDNSGTRIRMSVSPKGIQTMISYSDRPTVFMQPVTSNSGKYIVYNRMAKGNNDFGSFKCSTIDEYSKEIENNGLFNRAADDQTLRTFRLAVSVNGEYTQYHGGTVAGALAAINTTITRVNEVFETDMAVTFELVDADELIFTDPATDPYSSLSNWNGELQSTLNSTIGDGAYDIGHMFGASGGGGNAGCIGCVCVDGQKGSGITSPADAIPEGDNFDIDYVAHEIGHQVGANHTFAFSTEGTGVNSEPGSGTTIMGYAGITGSNDVQQHSDPYFHYHSIDQILDNLVTRTCWVGTSISNNPPSADAGADYTIPQGTAYVLRGSATDVDSGDNLTYCWEQIDSGQVTNSSFGPTLTSGSMNRSLPPTTSPDRYIPKVERVIAGQLTETSPTLGSDWETVATVDRTMNWALTVRDREPTSTGLNGQSSLDLTVITVDSGSGPFAVTSQTSIETWDVGSVQTITWDVAGTNGGAVNTPTVNILLSTDGGLTFPFVMASDVPNDGSHDAAVPVTGVDTNNARVKVEGNNNIFYAINSTNFEIQESEFVLSVADASVDVCSPDDATYTFTYNTFLSFTGTTDFSATGLPAGATAVFSPASASADGTVVTATISGTGSLAAGNYPFSLVGTSGSITSSADVELNVFDTSFSTLNLTAPADGVTDVFADNAMFSWDADVNAASYEIDIATDAGFTAIVESGTPVTNSYLTTSLIPDTSYFWRVRSVNDCGTGGYSTAGFTTANISCNSFASTDTPVAIPDSNGAGINSVINIGTTSEITDVNVTLNITHTWDSDLILTLTSPGGTSVILSDQNGSSGDNYTNTVFDQEATDPITSGAAPFTGTFQPEGDLSLFYGEFSGGDWTLNVSDNAGGDLGTIDNWTLEICGIPQLDNDGDGVPNDSDNCVDLANVDQADLDGDGLGDVCDDDIDGDGVLNTSDNCPLTANADQADADADGIGDLCEIECRNFTSLDTPITISTAGGVNYNAIINITDDLPIDDVNVTINITHTWVSDLDIFLQSPTGTIVELSTDNGGSSDDYTDTIFDDEGTISITGGSPPFTGIFQPEGSLADFNGEMTMGDWTLIVTDDTGGDGGVINLFELELCVAGEFTQDTDGDGVVDSVDNCVDIANADQADMDEDGLGDICDNDIDGDGVLNIDDNCPETPNADQADGDGDGLGDVCDFECGSFSSNDTPISISTAGGVTYSSVLSFEGDYSIGDVNVTIDITHTWDSDLDISLQSPNGTIVILSEGNGGLGDNYTNTVFDDAAATPILSGSPPFTGEFQPQGSLADINGESTLGDWTLIVTDTASGDGGSINLFEIEFCVAYLDTDGDGITDFIDNCPDIANGDQADLDNDGIGDVCDEDIDGDGILNNVDNCVDTANSDQADLDNDGIGDICDDDVDGDGVLNTADNCVYLANSDQADIDMDGIGDICDPDVDGDGVPNDFDNCPETPNEDQSDVDGNGKGDACDGLIVNDVLTPNGDGMNDVWMIVNIERFPNASIKVYNRWGNEVFSTNSYNNDWSGTSDSGGKTLPTGSYFYQIDQNGNGTVIRSGWIYITNE